MSRPVTRVLFVCLGNICRSPLAEGIFRHKVNERGVDHLFVIDSAGTGGWHAGNLADARMRRVAAQKGVALESRARQVHEEDYRSFDHILCMDESNHQDLIAMGAPAARLRLLLACDPNAPLEEVPDPYYGDDDGFERVFGLVDSACSALLDELLGAPG